MTVDLRQATEEDFARFKWCLSQDEAHREQDAEDWRSAPGEFMTFYDQRGNRVWVRIERVMRISIQHDPDVSKQATSKILYNGLRWLMGEARQKGFSELVFESTAPRLVRFFKTLFGFNRLRNNYSVRS
jgi:hypothetical protein